MKLSQETYLILIYFLIIFLILFIPACILNALIGNIVNRIRNRKNIKTFKSIEIPNWELVSDKNGDRIYKFMGFSNFDSKSKFLEIEKKNILNDTELSCWNLVNNKIKINKQITILTKIPIKELITITDEEKLFRGWRQKIEPVIIDFIIIDNFFNPIAGIQFKRDSETNKLIDDIFFNIRVPVFWLSKNKGTFEYQINDIFNRLNDYFEKANLIDKNRMFSRLYQDSE